jgi:hypothetical protein
MAGSSERHRPNETTSLLRGTLDFREHVHEGPCRHGTFSPRPDSVASFLSDSASTSGADTDSEQGIFDGIVNKVTGQKNWKKRWASKIKSKKMSTSSALAEQHGVQDSALM